MSTKELTTKTDDDRYNLQVLDQFSWDNVDGYHKPENGKMDKTNDEDESSSK